MILSSRQSSRFTRLFDLLMDYVSVRFEDEYDNTSHLSDQELIDALLSSVWGKDGDVSIIDDFIEENPARISPTDQRAVLAWKNAALDFYPVVLDGADTYFLYGGHAFAVRGITREIADQMRFIPGVVRTVLVPFDGLITYGTMLFDMSFDMGPDIMEDLEDDLASYKAAGKTVRTERQYTRLFPIAREAAEEKAKAVNEELKEFDYDPDNDLLVEGQHEGVLAGLTWEEREEVLKGVADKELRDIQNTLNKDLPTLSATDTPPATLDEYFSRYTRAELIEHARSHKMGGPLSKQRKADLIKTICAFHRTHAEDALDDAHFFGTPEVRFLSQLVEAKGRLIIKEEDVKGPADLPLPITPFMTVYQTERDFVVSMPQDLLASFADIDFEEEVALAERTDHDVNLFLSQVDFWGVMTDEDITYFLEDRGYAKKLDEAYHLIGTLVDRIDTGFTGCRRVRDNLDGRAYLVDEYLFEELDVDKRHILYDDEPIADILDQREGIPERVVYGLEPRTTVVSYTREKDSYRELCAFLDAHVPDGESDYYFAEDFADNLVLESRFITSPMEALDLIDDMGVVLTKPQMGRLVKLVTAVMNDTPCWANFGWSPNELRELENSRE